MIHLIRLGVSFRNDEQYGNVCYILPNLRLVGHMLSAVKRGLYDDQ
jgi:hypothetical protein